MELNIRARFGDFVEISLALKQKQWGSEKEGGKEKLVGSEGILFSICIGNRDWRMYLLYFFIPTLSFYQSCCHFGITAALAA